MPASSDASLQPGATVATLEKRQRVAVQVHLEANGDDAPRVHQMLGDGTYIPAEDSEFERTSAAASAFVARALAARHGNGLAEEDGESGGTQWIENAHKSVAGALYEIGRTVEFIESLRGNNEVSQKPSLQLMRLVLSSSRRKSAGQSLPAAVLRDAPASIMGARKSMIKCVELLRDRTEKMRKWIKDDNEFSEAFHYLRVKACGVRRSSKTGAPFIDVGDGNFAEVMRVDEAEKAAYMAALQSNSQDNDTAMIDRDPNAMTDGHSNSMIDKLSNAMADENPNAMVDDVVDAVVAEGASKPEVPLRERFVVRVKTPPSTFLCVGLSRLENDCVPIPAPVVQPQSDDWSDDPVDVVLRRIRLARVSAFRKMTFEKMVREASDMTNAIDFTNNSISVESGPYDVLRVDRTMRTVAPDLNVCCDTNEEPRADFRKLQDASLLQMVMVHQSLVQGKGVFPLALATTLSLSLLRALEKVLDDVVTLLGVRLEWARGGMRAEEARVWVWSDAADGDGPARPLLAIEPLSTKNNGGDENTTGHVKLTPAFGVIIPAPDDPNARGRAAVLLAQSSSSGGGSPTILFDDVPRSYVCPVHSGGEIVATVTLLLCIRLLDALELAARAGEPEVLDVDRQCFLVVVSSPQSGRTLRVKVWPKGNEPGHEVPATTAWLNGKIVEEFPTTAPGRLVAWKKLLKRLVADKTPQSAPSPQNSPPVQHGMINGGAFAQNAHMQAAAASARQQHQRDGMQRNANLLAAERQQFGSDSNTNGHHGLNGYL